MNDVPTHRRQGRGPDRRLRCTSVPGRPPLLPAETESLGHSSHMKPDDVEAAVRAVEADYDQAWNRGDLEQLLACFANDVVLVNPRGTVAVGLGQARAALSSFLAEEGQETEHHSEIIRVSVMGRDVAVVDGLATVTRGVRTVVVHPFTDVLSRTDDGWRIAHVRAYSFME